MGDMSNLAESHLNTPLPVGAMGKNGGLELLVVDSSHTSCSPPPFKYPSHFFFVPEYSYYSSSYLLAGLAVATF